MKKIDKRATENLIYKNENTSLTRINGILHLLGQNDYSTNDIFDILAWGISNSPDRDFWSAKITEADRMVAKPINIIYSMTGGDRVWKKSNLLWKQEWNKMHSIFLEHFEERLLSMLKRSNTLEKLRKKLNDKITCEDFYELGLKLDLVCNDEA